MPKSFSIFKMMAYQRLFNRSIKEMTASVQKASESLQTKGTFGSSMALMSGAISSHVSKINKLIKTIDPGRFGKSLKGMIEVMDIARRDSIGRLIWARNIYRKGKKIHRVSKLAKAPEVFAEMMARKTVARFKAYMPGLWGGKGGKYQATQWYGGSQKGATGSYKEYMETADLLSKKHYRAMEQWQTWEGYKQPTTGYGQKYGFAGYGKKAAINKAEAAYQRGLVAPHGATGFAKGIGEGERDRRIAVYEQKSINLLKGMEDASKALIAVEKEKYKGAFSIRVGKGEAGQMVDVGFKSTGRGTKTTYPKRGEEGYISPFARMSYKGALSPHMGYDTKEQGEVGTAVGRFAGLNVPTFWEELGQSMEDFFFGTEGKIQTWKNTTAEYWKNRRKIEIARVRDTKIGRTAEGAFKLLKAPFQALGKIKSKTAEGIAKGFGKMGKLGAIGSFALMNISETFIGLMSQLSPFQPIMEALSEIFGIFGEILGASMMPVIEKLFDVMLSPPMMKAIDILAESFGILGMAFMPLIEQIMPIFVRIIEAIAPLISGLAEPLAALMPIIIMLADLFATVIEAIMPLVISILPLLTIAIMGIGYVIVIIANVIITIVNMIFGIINAAISLLNFIPGVNIARLNYIGYVSIPTMAEGGIITRPTLVMAGESGAEAIVPLDRAGGSFGEGTVINIYGDTNPSTVLKLEREMWLYSVRKRRATY